MSVLFSAAIGAIRRLSESFVPALTALILIGATTVWVDRVAVEFASRPLVIEVSGSDAAWDPERVTDDGIIEAVEGPASDPAAAVAELEEARVLARAGDFDRAITLVEKLTKTRPEPAFWNELGVYRIRAGQLDKAQKAFDAALAVQPKYTRALYNRALARSGGADRDGARADYAAALALEPAYLEARYNLGLLLLDAGDVDGSIRELTAASKLGSNDDKARSLFSLGVSLARAGKTKEALAAYERSIEFRPAYLLPRYNQATVLMGRGDADSLDRARRLVDQLLSLSPDFAPGWFLAGRLASRSGDERRALAAYEKAARLDRRFWKAHYNWGLVAMRLDELTLADTLFTRLASEFPKRPESNFNLGRIHYRRERYAEAVEQYQKAIQRAGGRYAEAQMNLALALDELGKYSEALAILKAIPAADVDRGALLVNRSLVEKHLGDVPAARASLEEAIAASPTYATAYYNLGKLETEAADALRGASRADVVARHEAAVRAFEKALALDPKNTKAAVNLGVSLGELGRWDDAIAAYRSALAESPSHRSALFNLGIALKETKRYTDAADTYRSLLALDDENIKAYLNLAVVYADLGQGEMAIQTIEAALERDPGHVALRYNLAIQLRKLGRVAEGLAELERCVALAPTYRKAARLLAQLYQRLGRTADAAAVLRPAAEGAKATAEDLGRLARAQLAADDAAGARDSVDRALVLDAADERALDVALTLAAREKRLAEFQPRLALALSQRPDSKSLIQLKERLTRLLETP
ncbi:MAG: tetratricopeptide repeat protein [Myxococcales bacterium]|nr:tetratricopeptide repeat protein [Myxococcales bacterium]